MFHFHFNIQHNFAFMLTGFGLRGPDVTDLQLDLCCCGSFFLTFVIMSNNCKAFDLAVFSTGKIISYEYNIKPEANLGCWKSLVWMWQNIGNPMNRQDVTHTLYTLIRYLLSFKYSRNAWQILLTFLVEPKKRMLYPTEFEGCHYIHQWAFMRL